MLDIIILVELLHLFRGKETLSANVTKSYYIANLGGKFAFFSDY